MSTHAFEIPPEFKEQLRYLDVTDNRSDSEILASLKQYRPVTSEKNIWAFWDSGIDSMPAWCQRNVIDWVRINGPSWTIRVLDSVPDSPNYALKYLPADSLPEAFVKNSMDGPYVGPHSADFLRGASLYQFGGVFMDVGIILVRSIDRICWRQLEDPNSPYQVAAPLMYSTHIANHFVASRKGDPFIKRWHDLFTYLWKDRTNHKGLISHPLVSFAKDLKIEDANASKFHWDFDVPAATVFEYVTQVVVWDRLCMLEGSSDAAEGDTFNSADYWRHHILLFDSLEENWGAEATIGFAGSGERMLQLFSLPLSTDRQTQDYQDAYRLVWRLLTRSSMQKITHGKGLTTSIHLGVLWDRPENKGKDCAPGTFGELLRYGTVHFAQTRDTVVYCDAPEPPKLMKKGVFEV